MNILDTIVAHKKIEVAERKRQTSVAELEKGYFFSNETLSLKIFLDPENRYYSRV
jgi:indole-3-glycerol phosphate synthase